MKNSRQYTLSGISVFLLLCFSFSVLPLDALHSHLNGATSGVSCSPQQGQTCQHKSHLGNSRSFCWICAMHADAIFVANPPVSIASVSGKSEKVVVVNSLLKYQSDIHFYNLRGPPCIPAFS